MNKFFLGCVLCLLLIVSCSTSPVFLEGIETPEISIITSRGTTIASGKTGDIVVAGTGRQVEDGEVSILLSLINCSPVPYDFSDTSISIYYGNKDSNKWQLLETWDAQQYYKNAYRYYKVKAAMTAFAGALNTISASFGSNSTSSIYGTGGFATVSTHSYNYSDVLLASKVAELDTLSVQKEGKAYLSYLENNLLYPTTLFEGEEYAGWLFFDDMGRKGPDYKIVVTNELTSEILEFVFVRSDREKLI